MIDEDETDEKIGTLSIIRTFIVSNSEKTKNKLVPDNGGNLNYSLIHPKNEKSSVNFPRVGRQFTTSSKNRNCGDCRECANGTC